MEQRYLALTNLELKKLCLNHKKFIKKYIQEKRCKCVDEVRTGEMLNCKHLRKALKEEFKEDEEKIWNYTVDAVADDLEKMNLNPNRLKVKG